MTVNADAQRLIDDAVATLKQTTVGYANHSAAWQKNTTTKWSQGLDKLAQARARLDPPVSVHEILPPLIPVSQTITVSNLNRYLSLDRSKDYIISGSVTAKGGLILHGGRNIVLRDFECLLSDGYDLNVDNTHAIAVYNLAGTLHMENVWVHGDGVGQALLFALQSPTDRPVVQIQRCRLEADHPQSDAIHTDVIQSYGGPTELHLHQVTLASKQGTLLQIQPHNLQVQSPVGHWSFHSVNCVQTEQGAKYALWKNFDRPAEWPVEQSDVWVRNTGYLAWANSDGGRGIEGWNPGGAWNVTGESWHMGLRPAGDFVPAGTVGIGYTAA